MDGKIMVAAALFFILVVCLVMPMVSAEKETSVLSAEMEECFASDFELKIGEYVFFFEFSKSSETPSLKYLICKYKEMA